MKKSYVVAIILIGLICSCHHSKSITPMQKFDYKSAWNKVKEFENQGLPESALKTVQEIYTQANKESNAPQLVKAVIHKMKFTDYKQEDSFIKNINQLESEIQSSGFPAKPLLHSMLAQMYWQYYQNNQWRFSNRSEVADFDQEDISTWGLSKIVEGTIDNYRLSLENASKSKDIKIDAIDEVLTKGNTKGRAVRPTMYDFLAHRAVDFFMNQEPDINKPAYHFQINEEKYLEEAKTFAGLKITTKDELSYKFYALTIFQGLIDFHLNDATPEALINVELKRLAFVKNHHTLPNKDQLYLKALEKLEKRYQSHADASLVTHAIAQQYVEWGRLYQPLQTDDHQWDLKKAFEMAKNTIGRHPNSDGAILCKGLQNSILTKTLSANVEEVNLPAQPFRVRLGYQNINQVYWRVVPTTDKEVREQRKKWEKNYNVDKEQKFLEYFIDKSPSKSGKVSLPDQGDYQEHGVEIKLDALEKGLYIVLLSHKPDFVPSKNGMAYALTTISNLSFVHRSNKDGSTDFYVAHRKSGIPMEGVKAQVVFNKYDYQQRSYTQIEGPTYTTDRQGQVQIPFQSSENNNKFLVNFSFQNDWLSTSDPNNTYGGQFYQHKQQKNERRLQTFLFLDRAIYRPGQTVYFKGLVVQTDGKDPEIQPNYTTSIHLYDVNRQEVSKKKFTTNAYGSFHGSFIAPSTGLTGQMYLEAADGSGNISFSVEEYKRPKFEVNFEPIKGTFKLAENIDITGKALAYSGANIDGAQVKYRVVRRARFPFWCWVDFGYYPNSPEVEITNGTTETDGLGKFSVSFAAQPDLNINKETDPTFSFTIYADITDINGETHSQETTVNVGYKALVVSSDISDIDKNNDSLSAKGFSINTSNLSGSFEPAKGNITIWKLKSPITTLRKRKWARPDQFVMDKATFKQHFPNDIYEDEGNYLKWEKEKEVFQKLFDTGEEKAFKPEGINEWKNGRYVLEIKAKDRFGEEVKSLTYFTLFDSGKKQMPYPTYEYFGGINKNSFEPGDTAEMLLGTSAKSVKVLYEIEQDGQILSQKWLSLSKEQTQIKIPIKESYRGNVAAHFTFTKDNEAHTHSAILSVPYTNKQLDISFETFRNKLLPGEKEQWKLKIKGPKAEKIAAEMAATLYDASLDVFRSNSWYAGFYGSNYSRLQWQSHIGFGQDGFRGYVKGWNDFTQPAYTSPEYDYLNWFGLNLSGYFRGGLRMAKSMAAPQEMEMSAVADGAGVEMKERAAADMVRKEAAPTGANQPPNQDTEDLQSPEKKEDLSTVKARTNFNETAFFYPNLKTNENGEIIINFTIPEALTRWKMLGFAHTKDLKSASVYNQLVTQKELMVVPNQPRFFRENDTMFFSAKITSLAETPLSGQAELSFFDALSMKPIDQLMKHSSKSKNFTANAGESTNLSWEIEIPEGIQAITYRIVAKAGDFSDGEEMTLPVTTNRMLVTETLPLPIRGGQTKKFTFEKLANNKSNTLKHHRYSLEFTSNPSWYAVQALPYLMEYPYECIEQVFSRYYANAMASHIANSHPKIKRVFDTWKNIQPDALLSNLEKNQELKSALLEETPWVLQAKDEKQRKRQIGLLFDLNRMGDEQQRALSKITKAQVSSGGFPWFPGLPEDRYITQHIVAGVGHLDVLGIKAVRNDRNMWQMIGKAVQFLDSKIKYDYDKLKRAAKNTGLTLEDNHLSYAQIHYLYARSYFSDVKINPANQEAFDYFLGQAKKYWLRKNRYLEGMLALALHRYGNNEVPSKIIKSLNERALHSEELGMYWKMEGGYFWYQAPIETQALMIEVYDEVAKDQKAVEDLQVWLLKQKQTQDWKTTKATAEACYALLLRGTDLLVSDEQVEIKVGKHIIDPRKEEGTGVEAGTGYFKKHWSGNEVNKDMGSITVTKKDDGVAWGAVYWQYFEQLDKITPAETPLKLKKQLFIEENTDRGPVIKPITDKDGLKVGDLIKVRIELRVDRNMEYVHLKDMRAAGFEPVSTLSTHRYQDGLWYYESTRDMATNFFIGYLPKGTYVFEYPLRVAQRGNFSNGVTTIQSMYAPEFTSHSEGIRVNIE